MSIHFHFLIHILKLLRKDLKYGKSFMVKDVDHSVL